MHGWIDDLQIFNKELGDAEVRTIFNSYFSVVPDNVCGFIVIHYLVPQLARLIFKDFIYIYISLFHNFHDLNLFMNKLPIFL